MADNYTTDAGAGGNTYFSDDIAGTHAPLIKIMLGALDANDGPVSTTNPMPIDIQEINGTAISIGGGVEAGALLVTIASDSTGVVSVDDGGGNISVDWGGTVPPIGAGTEAAALRVTVATDSTGVLSVDDNGANLSVDWAGTVPPIGAGTEAAALRVTLATDSTGLVSVDDNGGSLTIDSTALTTDDLDTGIGTDTRGIVGIGLAESGGHTLLGSANPMPVSDNGGAITVDWAGTAPPIGAGVEATALRVTVATDSTGVLSVDDGGGNLSVDWGGTVPPIGAGLEATALRVTLATDSTGLLSVDDNGGALTVDAANDGSLVTQIGDGTSLATVRNLAANDALNVAIVDGSGNQITSFGGGTQYTEDDAAAANPVGTAPILVRQDTPAGLVSLDGDNVAQRATNYGAAYCQIVTSSGAFVDSFGGSGGTAMADDGAFTVGTTQFTPAGGTYRSVRDLVDDNDAGAFAMNQRRGMYVTLEDASSNAVTVTSNRLVVDGSGVTQPISAASLPLPTGAATSANQLPDGHNVTVDNAAGASAVNIQDGGNAITVDWAGTAPPIGAGLEATALRVTVATDSTGVLSVDDNGGNLSVDWGGTVPPIGAGTEAAALRVTVATDSTGVLSVDDNGGALTVDQATAANLNAQVVGNAAADAAVTGNPVQIAFRASNVEPTAMSADGDVVHPWADRFGRLVTTALHPPDVATAGAHGLYTENQTAAADQELIAAPTAGNSIYVTSVYASNGGGSLITATLKEGPAGTARIIGNLAASGGGYTWDFGGTPWVLPAATALTGALSGAGDVDWNLQYFVAPTPA